MMRRFLFNTTAALVAVIGLAGSAFAQEFTFRFQSSDPAGNPNFEYQKGWTDLVAERSGGKVKIELLPVGSVVEYNETLDAVAAGILDGQICDSSYWAGKDPAFGLISNPVGAWSDPSQMIDFVENGGGKEIMQELLGSYGLHFIGVSTPGLEAFVSRVPLDGVDDLKGLKLRAPEGPIANVFAAAGAAPVNLPSSEVFTSLDKGVVDAADYSVFSVNQAQGLNTVAKHPVYPGFHSLPLVEVSMNKVGRAARRRQDDARRDRQGVPADPDQRSEGSRPEGCRGSQGRQLDHRARLVCRGTCQVPRARRRGMGAGCQGFADGAEGLRHADGLSQGQGPAAVIDVAAPKGAANFSCRGRKA